MLHTYSRIDNKATLKPNNNVTVHAFCFQKIKRSFKCPPVNRSHCQVCCSQCRVSALNCRCLTKNEKVLCCCVSMKHGKHAWSCMQGCIMQKDKTDVRPPLLASAGRCLHTFQPNELSAWHATPTHLQLF